MFESIDGNFILKLELISLHTKTATVSTYLNGFNFCNVTIVILFNINHLFGHSEVVTYIAV